MNSIFQRFALFVTLLGLAALAGCAGPAKVNPTRTSMMVTYSVSPGADGVTTTRTELCTFNRRLNDAQIDRYEQKPYLAIDEGVCKEFGQLAVHGSPSLAGEMTKTGVATATGGLVNYVLQKALQDNQGKICRGGGCITTVNSNENNNFLYQTQSSSSRATGTGIGNGSATLQVGCPQGNCPSK